MAWRDTIDKKMLKQFDRLGVIAVKTKLQLNEYTSNKKAALTYVQNIENEQKEKATEREKTAIRLSRRVLVVMIGILVVAVVTLILQYADQIQAALQPSQ